jgi:hypothetical protein
VSINLTPSLYSLVIAFVLITSPVTTESQQTTPTPTLNTNQQAFFDRIKSLCGARYEGKSVFPEDPGSPLSQSFPADSYTANLIPEAASNEWFLSFSADGQELTYYLERHGKPRYKAVLSKVPE